MTKIKKLRNFSQRINIAKAIYIQGSDSPRAEWLTIFGINNGIHYKKND